MTAPGRKRKGSDTSGPRKRLQSSDSTSEEDMAYNRYLASTPRVSFSTTDGKRLVIAKHRLVQNSVVFRDMFQVTGPVLQDQQSIKNGTDTVPIDVDVSAEVLTLFFDLLGVPEPLRGVSLATGIEETFELERIARKFEVQILEDWTKARIQEIGPWKILQKANIAFDLETARSAIRHLPIFHNAKTLGWSDIPSFWPGIARLTRGWQVELLGLLFPRLQACTKDDQSGALCIRVRAGIDLDKIADTFNPVP